MSDNATLPTPAARFPVGTTTRSMGRTITEGEFCLLNTLSWSISELHTNREAMAATPYGERLFAGTMLLAIIEGLHDSSDGLRELEQAHGIRLGRPVRLTARFRTPVMPGDTLWADTELVAADTDAEGPLLVFRDTVVNQRDEMVAEVERHFRAYRRTEPDASPPPSAALDIAATSKGN